MLPAGWSRSAGEIGHSSPDITAEAMTAAFLRIAQNTAGRRVAINR
jgi:hypothetical protein